TFAGQTLVLGGEGGGEPLEEGGAGGAAVEREGPAQAGCAARHPGEAIAQDGVEIRQRLVEEALDAARDAAGGGAQALEDARRREVGAEAVAVEPVELDG